MVVRAISMPGGDLDVAQVHSGVETGHERVPQTMRVGADDSHAVGLGEVSEAAGGCVPVHPSATGVEQYRPCGPAADGAIDRAADRWRQGSGRPWFLCGTPGARDGGAPRADSCAPAAGARRQPRSRSSTGASRWPRLFFRGSQRSELGPSTVTWSICNPPGTGGCWLASARAVQRNVCGPAGLP